MAAIDDVALAATAPPRRAGLGSIVLAALAVQTLQPGCARADSAPADGEISVGYMHYEDRQKTKVAYPDYDGTQPAEFKRITAKSPSLYLLLPLGAHWSVEATGVRDEVSGATPRYYSDVSGATPAPGMHDVRTAGSATLSHYFDRATLSAGASTSREDDYRSLAVSLSGRVSTADNNTTFNAGWGHSNDTISPVNHVVEHARKRTTEFTAGLTRNLTSNDVAQASVGWSLGHGYFDDPYKRYDSRPDRRGELVLLTSWNHDVEGLDGTLRSSYRYYRDSWGIRAHAIELSWVQSVGYGLSLTPSLRYSMQSAARFYVDPVMDKAIFPSPLTMQSIVSEDPRLAAFGALTAGMKVDWRLDNWRLDLGYERYEQRSNWRVFHPGSPNIDPTLADVVRLAVGRSF